MPLPPGMKLLSDFPPFRHRRRETREGWLATMHRSFRQPPSLPLRCAQGEEHEVPIMPATPRTTGSEAFPRPAPASVARPRSAWPTTCRTRARWRQAPGRRCSRRSKVGRVNAAAISARTGARPAPRGRDAQLRGWNRRRTGSRSNRRPAIAAAISCCRAGWSLLDGIARANSASTCCRHGLRKARVRELHHRHQPDRGRRGDRALPRPNACAPVRRGLSPRARRAAGRGTSKYVDRGGFRTHSAVAAKCRETVILSVARICFSAHDLAKGILSPRPGMTRKETGQLSDTIFHQRSCAARSRRTWCTRRRRHRLPRHRAAGASCMRCSCPGRFRRAQRRPPEDDALVIGWPRDCRRALREAKVSPRTATASS